MHTSIGWLCLLIPLISGQDGGSMPTFSFKPTDESFREGTVAKVYCEGHGDPRPSVEWFYRGNKIMHSRKHELSNENRALKIFPFLGNDVGSYVCRIQNVRGAVDAQFRLSLAGSHAPEIFDAPVSVSVDAGSQVSFRCRARGVPQPRITWTFDGADVSASGGGRYMISSDGTELTIQHVTRRDDGVVGCMADNAVGTVLADAKLMVRGRAQIDEAIASANLETIVAQAKDNVDRALKTTKEQKALASPNDFKNLFRFTIPAQAVELTKAREIYEESIRLVYKHVEMGLNFNGLDLSPNVTFESVLAPTHIQTIMELTGCQNGQFPDNKCDNMCFHSKYRSYDGQCNNFDYPMRGVSQWPLRRLLPPIYENGFNTPVGWDPDRLYHGFKKPNARVVSRELVRSAEITPHKHLSSFVFQWGQLIDHDLTHTAIPLVRTAYASGAFCNRTCENKDPCFNIPLLPGDPKLQRNNPHHQKYPCIEFERSGAICGSGETSVIFQRVTYREQMNIITSYLDASFVYGSTEVQALELRDLFGDHGMMRFDIVSTAQKPYMPFERDSDMDCRRNYTVENPMPCFLAGDLRANEQHGLTSMHTLFMREHNRIAARLLEINPLWDGEKIYQETRKIIGAFLQHITYSHWLPLVLGKTAYEELIGPYPGYDPTADATIANEFASAAFRFGHTIINPILRRLDNNFTTVPQGDIMLHEAFFAPERLLSEGGIDPILRGLFASPLKLPRPTQLLNSELIDHLYSRAHEIALDLASLNIQRARDHGLPGYTEYRRFCNLSVPTTWAEMKQITPDQEVIDKLMRLYGHPGNIDLWIGAIVEPKLPEGLVGPLFACLISEQFRRTRAGDRHWYENEGVFTKDQLHQIKKVTVSRLLCDNGDNIDRVQKNVFLYPGNSTALYEKCDRHPMVNLNMWMSCCDSTCGGSLMMAEDEPPKNMK